MDIDTLLGQIDGEISKRGGGNSVDQLLSQIDKLQGGSGAEVVYVAKNGGRVTRGTDGNLSYADKVFATSDPAQIDRIMKDDSAGQVSISSFDQQTIGQAPFVARAQEFVRGTPFVGSYTDEAAEFLGGKGQTARALSGAMQRQNPVETTALNLGGAVVGSAPAAALLPEVASVAPTSRIGQAAMGVGLGGGLGATEGAVYQYGENGDALKGAIWGGTLGAVLGGASPYAAEGIKNLSRWFKKTDVAAISAELGISSGAATVIRNAFRSGDNDLAMDALERAGQKAMLADAGQPARELLDAAAQSGGEAGAIARRAVDERAAGAASSLEQALDDALGVPVGQRTATEGIRSATSSGRSAAYQAAYAKPIDYSTQTGRYIEILLGRVPQSAINAANEIMGVQGAASRQILAEIGDNGSVSYRQLPDVQQLHYILQGLSDTAEGAKGQFGRDTTKSTAYGRLRAQLSNALQRAVPEFAEAQAKGKAAIDAVNAVDTGYNLLKNSFRREDAVTALRNVPKSEREAVAQGVRSYIDDTLSNVKRTITDPNVDARQAMQVVKDLSSPASRQKLTMLLGKSRSDKLFEAIDRETVALELRAAIATNSKTAIRQSIQEGVKDQTSPGLVGTLMQGEGIDATKRMVQAITGETPEARQLREMGLFEEIASVLTQTRGEGAKKALAATQKAIAGEAISDEQAARIARVLTASSAAGLYQLTVR